MDKIKQLIIIGGGASIQDGIDRGLWEKLQGKFTIGLNFCYRYFTPTVLSYVDYIFYDIGDYNFSQNQQKEHVNKLSTLPLIVGKYHAKLKKLDNTIMLKTNENVWYRDIRLGCYSSRLAGLFALSLGIYLLNEGEIYLVGFDGGSISDKVDNKNRKITHFYNDIEHRGTGKCDYYNGKSKKGKKFIDRDFEPYLQETKCHIYNVSLKSKITTFPKLNYSGFFYKLDDKIYNQEELRENIRRKLQ